MKMLTQNSSDIIDPRPLSRLINNAALKAVITRQVRHLHKKNEKNALMG